jgi:protein-tyrosine phosphatase
MTLYPFNYNWIEAGKILAGSMPTSGADIVTLKGLGIYHILSLTRRSLTACEDCNRELGDVTICHAPIVDSNIPDDETALKAVNFMDECYQTNKPFFIHCRGGVGRTGILLDAYYVWRRGMMVEQAKPLLMNRHCPYTGNYAGAGGSPQSEWVAALEANRK